MVKPLLQSYLDKYFSFPKWLQLAIILLSAFILLVAWPLAVAAIYSLIVLKTIKSPPAKALLLLAMMAPALIMEFSWGQFAIAQISPSPPTTLVSLQPSRSPSSPNPTINPQVQGASQNQSQSAKVLQAISGDTLDVDIDGQPFRVHLLGLDAPQMATKNNTQAECFAPESHMFLDSLLRGRQVKLQTDPSQGELTGDTLQRYVAMVDGTSVNKLMLEAGLAKAQSTNHQQSAEYQAYSQSAKAAKKGLWLNCLKTSPTPPNKDKSITTPTQYNQTIKPSASSTPTPVQPTAIAPIPDNKF